MSETQVGLPIKKAFGFAWSTFKRHPLISLALVLVPLITEALSSFLIGSVTGIPFLLAFPLLLLSILLPLISNMGVLKVALKLVDGEPVQWSDFIGHYRYIFRYILGALASMFVIAVGSLFFIIPGIILAVKYHFTLALIVDKGMSPLSAMEESVLLTQGVTWKLFLFWLLSLVIFLVCFAMLALFDLLLSCFVVFPLVMLANIYLMRHLQKRLKPLCR